MDLKYQQRIDAIRKYIGEKVDTSKGKEDFTDAIKPLLQMKVDLNSKFSILDFKSLLANNGKNNQTLSSLCEFLEKVEAICMDLKKHFSHWNFIHASHSVYLKMLEIKGGKELFQLIGYTDVDHRGLQIYEKSIPQWLDLMKLLVDIIIARCELTEYLLNYHPNPFFIDQALKEFADSDYSCSICGVQQPIVICDICSSKSLCKNCDATWHSHPKRVLHERVKRNPVSQRYDIKLNPKNFMEVKPNVDYISLSNPVENHKASNSTKEPQKQCVYVSDEELRDISEMSIEKLKFVLNDLRLVIKATENSDQKQILKRKGSTFLSVLNKKIEDNILEMTEHIKTAERHIQVLVMKDPDFYRRESYSQLNENKLHTQKKLSEMRNLREHYSNEVNWINYMHMDDVFSHENKDCNKLPLCDPPFNSDRDHFAKKFFQKYNSSISTPEISEKLSKPQLLTLSDDVAPPPDLEYESTLRKCIDKSFPILPHLSSNPEPFQPSFDISERTRSNTLSDIPWPQRTRALSPLFDSQSMVCKHRKGSQGDESYLVCPLKREMLLASADNVPPEQQQKQQICRINQETQMICQERLQTMELFNRVKESSVDPTCEEVLLNQAAAPLSLEHSLPTKSLYLSAVSSIHSQNMYSPAKEAKKVSMLETLNQLNEKKINIEMQTKAGEVVRQLRLAEVNGYEADVMLIALEKHGQDGMDPLDWIKNKWPYYISTVIALAANKNIHGLLEEDVVYALKQHNGNVEEALETSIMLYRKRMEQIKSLGDFSEEKIIPALLKHNGNVDSILEDLVAPTLVEFQQRVWQKEEEPKDSFPKQLVNLLLNKDINPERRVRAAFAEIAFKGWRRAEYVIKILDNHLENVDNCEVTDVVDVVQNSSSFENAVEQLTIVCNLCLNQYPQGKIMTLSFCDCKFCQDCFLQNFKIRIREEPVRRWTCPICNLPELNDEETVTNYFAFLNLQLKQVIDEDTFNLYETKLRDWHLHKDPNFRWCPACENGFLYQGDPLKMNCPHCNRATCFKCMKPWQDQHQKLSCKKFNDWLIANDPNNQASGLKLILKKNGIVCPDCQTPYFLAKGGCIHFTCKNCQHEFCAGCQKTFYQKEKCHKFNDCPTKGIHAHHPRDCLYYLRDEDVKTLQKLLKSKNVHYDIHPPTTQENPHHCFIMVQKEINGNTLKDEKCGSDVPDAYAGLCSIHYKEYLVSLINQNKLDPVSIFTTDNLKQILSRNDKNIPEKLRGISDKEYRHNLEALVKQTEHLAFGD